jgi:hypothetical protein
VESPSVDPWENAPERWLLSSGYRDVAEIIGWKNAVDLGVWVYETKKRHKPGTSRDRRGTICIPMRRDNTTAQGIAEVIGEAAASLLIQECPGCRPIFGSIEPASIPRRNRAIVEVVTAGEKISVVACTFGITERQVRNIYRKENAA